MLFFPRKGLLCQFIPRSPELDERSREDVMKDVELFVQAEIRRACLPVRLGAIALGTVVIPLFHVVKAVGKEGDRYTLLRRMESVGGTVVKTYFRLIRTLTLVAYYDHPTVTKSLCENHQ